jgi:hypothetical protein
MWQALRGLIFRVGIGRTMGVFAVNWIARARNVSTTSYGVFGVGANDNGMQFIVQNHWTFDLLIQNRADHWGGQMYNGTIARLAYYPVRLTDSTLQALTTYGVVSSFPYSLSIKGKDILALKEVNRASTRDFVFIKGLASKVQPRITTASQYTASGVALRNAAMLKVAPTTSGNYFFSSGLTLSGATFKSMAPMLSPLPLPRSVAPLPLCLSSLLACALKPIGVSPNPWLVVQSQRLRLPFPSRLRISYYL